jgi:hypothetical protein
MVAGPCGSGLLAGEDLLGLVSLDERIEDDDDSFLVFVGKPVELAIEGAELEIPNSGLAARLGPSDKLVEADPENLGNLDQSVQMWGGGTLLPAIVNARADAEELGQAYLGELPLGAECLELFGEGGHVEEERLSGLHCRSLLEKGLLI